MEDGEVYEQADIDISEQAADPPSQKVPVCYKLYSVFH